MSELWVSSKRGTCWVQISEQGNITDTAPLWRKFIGQKVERLFAWLGECRVENLKEGANDDKMDAD